MICNLYLHDKSVEDWDFYYRIVYFTRPSFFSRYKLVLRHCFSARTFFHFGLSPMLWQCSTPTILQIFLGQIYKPVAKFITSALFIVFFSKKKTNMFAPFYSTLTIHLFLYRNHLAWMLTKYQREVAGGGRPFVFSIYMNIMFVQLVSNSERAEESLSKLTP